jgi:NADH dehydrogenase
MRIVLLGATGFVGHHLLPALSAAGHQCIVLCRYRPGCRELTLIPNLELRQGDVHDPGFLESQLAGADAVINLVGILNESRGSRGSFQFVHVELVEKLIAACRRTGVKRLIHMSALNAGKGDSDYLVSKGKAEEAVRQADDLHTTLIQPSVIFGEGDAFLNRFAGLLKIAPVLPLACPQARLQPVWIGDVVTAITASLDDPESFGKSLVLVGPAEYTLISLVERIACLSGARSKVIGLPDGLSRLQARIMEWVPGKPFSRDNYRSLQTASVSEENALWRFGIEPRSLESVASGFLGGSIHQHELDRCREETAGR